MRYRSLPIILFALIPSFANGEEPALAAKAAPASSAEQKQEKNSLLDNKLAELKRLQAEIKQLRDELNEQQQVGLDLQVYEVNHTKLRNLGFDWGAMIDASSSGLHKDAAGFSNHSPTINSPRYLLDGINRLPLGCLLLSWLTMEPGRVCHLIALLRFSTRAKFA